jgi:Putative zinc-finger
MTDHETFVLLAAKQLNEPLSPREGAELAAHLTGCPSCRSMATGMRRDNIRLQADLGAAKVSPRVRARVLDEASGRRRIDSRLVLGLAAVLLLGVLAVPFFAGGRTEATPPPSTRAQLPSLAPTPSPVPSLPEPSSSAPTASPSSPDSGAFVAGSYVYGTRPARRDTVAAQFEAGEPVGEWSRISPADGSGDTYSGTITCLVIDGSTAWMAGPTTTATDGTEAALIVVHDGGPDGADDTALMWLTRAGQTLATVTNWCVNKFTPAGPPLPLTEGDVEIHGDQSAASPSPSPAGASVAAAYTYGQRPPRKDTVVARLEDGEPVGEWSRIMPADGSGHTWGGPITCLVFDGSDVWLAGPATTSTDGITEAAMIHLHDGGPGGENDSALIWLAPRGQTITTVTNWCLTKFEPAELSPLTNGDIEIQDGR